MEVLIGRYEVINGLKSERNRRPVPMRFAGEYHFPGGAKRQTDLGPLQTACRELHEEFGIGVMNSSSGVMGPPELAATLFRKAQVDLGSSSEQRPRGERVSAPAAYGEVTAPAAEEVAAEARPLQRDVFVFIADVADNPEIKNISTEQINQGLRRRRQQFERLQASH